MRLTVTGIGHLGLVHAVCMAKLGHQVLGMDSEPERVELASRGEPWFSEPDLTPLLRRYLDEGTLSFTSSPQEVAEFARVHFVCVPTPGKADGSANLDYLSSAVRALAGHVRDKHVIAGKSTVPPGTARNLQRTVEAMGSTAEIAWNPEFLREGHAVADTLHPDRIIIGSRNKQPDPRLLLAYDKMITEDSVPLYLTDWPTAELSKLAANAFLATKISFFNGIAQLASNAGADAYTVAETAGCDERIGDWGTRIGLGYGGGCLPKDLRMLRRAAESASLSSFPLLLGTVNEINRTQRTRTSALAHDMLNGVSGKRIAVLGLAFKRGTSDTRDSPGLAVADLLRMHGAHVATHDPEAELADIGQVKTPGEAIEGADLVIVCTEWPEYRDIDPAAFPAKMIIDARYSLYRQRWVDAGWEYRGLDD